MKTKGMVAWIALIAMIMGGFTTPLQAENIEGNENLITKDIQIDDYTAIQIGNINQSGGSFKSLFSFITSGGNSSCFPQVYYQQGNKTTLKVTTDENILSVLTFQVENNELKIRTKEGTSISPSKLLIETSSKDLNELSVSGGTDFFLKSALETESIEVNVSGGADVKMEESVRASKASFNISGGADLDATQLACEKVSVSISGGADATLAGTTRQADLSASSGSDLDAKSLKAEDVSCDASSGADITVYATKTLQADASSGADISYKGDPKTDISASSGGDVNHIN